VAVRVFVRVEGTNGAAGVAARTAERRTDAAEKLEKPAHVGMAASRSAAADAESIQKP